MATTGGSSFFPEQTRLLQEVLAIRALGREIGVAMSEWLPEDELAATLMRRRGLLVLGAVNAGKSTLINALCAAPVCAVSKLPQTKAITIHQSVGGAAGGLSHNQADVRLSHDVPFIGAFDVVDTPGTNGFTPELLESVVSLAARCDFVVVVLAATNPWEPATWDVLSRLPASGHHKLVFVLQQVDSLAREDIDVLLGHVKDLARKRCGITPPVFPIAAPAPIMDQRAQEAAGCTALLGHLVGKARADHAFRDALADWKRRAFHALHELDDHLDRTRREIGHKSRLLDEVEKGVALIHASFRRDLESRMDALASVLRAENTQTLRQLRRRLWLVPSLLRLFTKDRTAAAMETVFVQRLQSAFENIGEEDAMAIVSACREHVQTVAERLRQDGISMPLRKPEWEARMAEAAARFRQRLDHAAGVRIEEVHVRNRLVRMLRRRNRALSAFVASFLIFLTLGAVAGALGFRWPAYVLCSIALLFLLGGSFVSWRTKPGVLEAFDTHMSEACGSFAMALLVEYEHALHGLFCDYADTLAPLRSSLARREAVAKPWQKRWQEIFLRLKALEQDAG